MILLDIALSDIEVQSQGHLYFEDLHLAKEPS